LAKSESRGVKKTEGYHPLLVTEGGKIEIEKEGRGRRERERERGWSNIIIPL